MQKPRYEFRIHGNEDSNPFQLQETVLHVFKLNEVSRHETDLFRLQFDSASSITSKMKVIKVWVYLISNDDS